MTQESELELAQRLLLETQPKALNQMVPLTTIDPPGVPMRDAPFDLGIPAKAQIGSGGGGGNQLPVLDSIILQGAFLYNAEIYGIVGDPL